MTSKKQQSVDSEDIMTDADFEKAMAALQEEGDEEVNELIGETSNEPIKSSLPQQTRPTEPDNDTDVERTPIPKIKRMIEAIKENEYLEKLSLANMGLYDMDLEPLIEAALNNQSLEEIKAVNQGVAFSTQTEREIIEAIMQNRGLTKVSINLRLPEGRFKVEQATIRNQEISKQPSGAAAELAKQHIPAKLAIAGVNTPRPSTSESEPIYLEKKTAVRERAREADEKSKKPYEPEKNAERAILAEKSKQKNAAATASKWPPNSRLKSKDSKDEEEQPKVCG
uniref:Tropomodulin n=2 Tax=Meloidogyne TaxID=189290 RepID=A0A915MEP0_MELJA